MEVIIDINCLDKSCFSERISQLGKIVPRRSRVHIDIADGIFSPTKSFVDTRLLEKIKKNFRFEAHLMVDKIKESYFSDPFSAILIHVSKVDNWEKMLFLAHKYKKQVGVVFTVGGKLPSKTSLPGEVRWIQVLAVTPGPSNQSFNKKALPLIRFLRKNFPNATISVDGGMNEETARLVKKAGADAIVSASYIWNSENPADAYRKLKSV